MQLTARYIATETVADVGHSGHGSQSIPIVQRVLLLPQQGDHRRLHGQIGILGLNVNYVGVRQWSLTAYIEYF